MRIWQRLPCNPALPVYGSHTSMDRDGDMAERQAGEDMAMSVCPYRNEADMEARQAWTYTTRQIWKQSKHDYDRHKADMAIQSSCLLLSQSACSACFA